MYFELRVNGKGELHVVEALEAIIHSVLERLDIEAELICTTTALKPIERSPLPLNQGAVVMVSRKQQLQRELRLLESEITRQTWLNWPDKTIYCPRCGITIPFRGEPLIQWANLHSCDSCRVRPTPKVKYCRFCRGIHTLADLLPRDRRYGWPMWRTCDKCSERSLHKLFAPILKEALWTNERYRELQRELKALPR